MLAMAKGFGDERCRLEVLSRAHDPMQDMRWLILWEATEMIVASSDGFASNPRQHLDN
jgi:hypothetical protein